MWAALRRRNFALLWAGGLVSGIGDYMLSIAIPFYIYQRTGSTVATGGVYVAIMLPWAFFGSVAGVFVDRWDRRQTMLVCDCTRAVLILLLLTVRSLEGLWLIYVVVFLEQGLSLFFGPANSALVPRLVGEEHLVAANALESMANSVTRLVAPSLGGAFLAWFGLPSVVIADSVSYVVSGVMIFLLAMPALPAEADTTSDPTTTVRGAWEGLWHDWRDGLRLIANQRLLVVLFLIVGVETFSDAINSVLLAPFAQSVMRISAAQFGWVVTAFGIGGLLSGAVIGQFGTKAPPKRLLVLGLGGVGILVVLRATFPLLPVVLTLALLQATPSVAWSVSSRTLLQNSVTDLYRGRVFGAQGTTNALLRLGGSILAGALGNRVGIVPLIYLVGVLSLIAALLALALLPRGRPTDGSAVMGVSGS